MRDLGTSTMRLKAVFLCATLAACQSGENDLSDDASGGNDSSTSLNGVGGKSSSNGSGGSGAAAAGGGEHSGVGGAATFDGNGGSSELASGGGESTSAGGQSSGSGGNRDDSAAGGSAPAVEPMHAEPLPIEELPLIEEMPDPLTMNDGTKVTTSEQWTARRQEMIRILEDYTYGHMPPSPENVSATTSVEPTEITSRGGTEAEYRMLRLSFGPDEELGFDLGIFTPLGQSGSEGPADGHPVLVSLASSAGESSLGGAEAALARGYAVVTVPYQQLGEDSPEYRSTGFFSAYPDYDWRDFSAWAWGISRAVDYLVTDPSLDGEKIAITGVSRLGQAVLLAGAFDERIALSAPVAGGMAFRFSGQEMGGGLGQGITEVVDQNTYWFGPRFPDFRNQTPKLPSDQHWLPALTAPRLFIMCNSLEDPYGRAYAAAQSYLGAKPVYEFLEVEKNLGQNFRPGGHGATDEDWSAILDFADQYLLGMDGTRNFDVLPPDEQLP